MEIHELQSQIREAECRIREIRKEECRIKSAEAQAKYDPKFEEWRSRHLAPTGFTTVPPPYQGVWAKPNPKAFDFVIAELITDAEYGWTTAPMTDDEWRGYEDYKYQTFSSRPNKQVLHGHVIGIPDSVPEPVRAQLEPLLPIRIKSSGGMYAYSRTSLRDGISAYSVPTGQYIPSVYGEYESTKAFVKYWTWLETCNENEPWPGLEMVPGYSGRYCKVPDHWDANMIVTAAYIWAHHRNPYFGKHTQSVMARAYPSLNIRCVKPDHLYSRSFIQIYQTPYDLVDTVFVYVEDGASADFTHDARFTEQDYTALADMLAESVLGDTEGIMYSYRVRDLQPAATPSCPIFQWFEKAGYDLQMSIHIMLDDRDLDTLRFHFRPHTESLKSYTHDEMLQILFDLRIAARPKAFKWQPIATLMQQPTATVKAPKKRLRKVTTIVTEKLPTGAGGKKKVVINSTRPRFLSAPGPKGETSDAFANTSGKPREADDDNGDGDGEDDMHVAGDPKVLEERVLHLSSYDRDTLHYPDAADCVLSIQPIQDIKDIELMHFELPHPRNTIESGYNSRFVFSEYYDDFWHVFAANIPEGTYTARTLCDMLTNCMLTAHSVNSTANVKNTYVVTEDAVGGRIRISSASTANNEQVPFQIHCGIGSYSDKAPSSRSRARYVAVEVRSISVATDQVTFKAESSAIRRWGPGHMLRVATKQGTVTAQVVSWSGSVLQLRTGDLSVPFVGQTDLSPITISSAHHTDPSLSQVLGFDIRDLYDDTLMPLVTCTNPTAIESDGTVSTVAMRIGVEFAMGLATGRFITFHNTGTFLDGEEYAIASSIGETHATITVDLERIWSNGVVLYDALGNQVAVSSGSITYLGTTDGMMTIELGPLATHSINVAHTELYILGFLGTNSPVEVDVDSWDGTSAVTVSFIYPWSLEIDADNFPVLDYTSTSTVPAVQLINAHGVNLMHLCSNRYDISASRRIVFIKLSLNNGSIPIGNIRLNESDNSTYFGRIQLDSGPLQVQFAQADKLYGYDRLLVPTKKIDNMRFEIFTEDGLHYPLNGLNWSITLRIRHRHLATIRST